MFLFLIFFFKQKTAYEMRISDWSSDVCSSDLFRHRRVDFRLGVEAADGEPDRAARPRLREAQGREDVGRLHRRRGAGRAGGDREARHGPHERLRVHPLEGEVEVARNALRRVTVQADAGKAPSNALQQPRRSEEHTSELQSLMRISYAVFCLKKKKQKAQRQRE